MCHVASRNNVITRRQLTMWFESQNCAMMGVQVTAGKRKLETAATAGVDSCPAKAGRWEPAGADDCIARLQAVAVPGDAWRPTPAPPAATALLADDFDDDDDFEDELSDDDRCSGAPDPLRYATSLAYRYQQPAPPPPPVDDYQHQQQQQQQAAAARAMSAGPYWQYYGASGQGATHVQASPAPLQPVQPQQQQTMIRCEENGKSYLELGAAPPMRARCCDGRTRWCNVPCYRQRRLAVLNLSMCKLARYRQCSDPSLRRSVLICNTLRHIEREMEAEGQQPCAPPPPPEPCYSPFAECAPRPTPVVPVPVSPPPPLEPAAAYEQSLRELGAPSGRATPFPSPPPPDSDSGIGDEDAGRTINWGSVLSLTSQTDLEPLNNNELYAELGLSTGDLHDWKEPAPRADGEWDTFMHVLVGGS